MYDESYTIVIDNGSNTCKAGFANENAPRSVFPLIIGQTKYGNSHNCKYIGDDAEGLFSILEYKYPIEHGIVKDWYSMEVIFHHIFYHKLRVDPEECSICLTESIFNPKENQEKKNQIMFEKFNVPSLYIFIFFHFMEQDEQQVSFLNVDMEFHK